MKLFELKDKLDNLDWSALAEDFRKKQEKYENFMNRYVEKIHNMSLVDRLKFYQRVHDKYESSDYIDKEYRAGYQPRQDIYFILLEYARKYGKEIEIDSFIIDDKWSIELFVGQGVVIEFEPIS